MQKDDASATERRGRGRPRAFDRDAALTAAMQLFWQKGYSATSMTDLTAAMGIGSPSLYAAFGSKEALYAEALEHYTRTNEGVAWGGFFAADTARDAIRALFLDTAAGLSHVANGCMVILSSVGREGHADLGALVAAARDERMSRLVERIAAGQAAGEIGQAVDAHALARFVLAVQNGMSILARDGASCEELAGVAETALLGWDARVNA